MIDEIEIVDGHMHVFTSRTYKRFEKAVQSKDKHFKNAFLSS